MLCILFDCFYSIFKAHGYNFCAVYGPGTTFKSVREVEKCKLRVNQERQKEAEQPSVSQFKTILFHVKRGSRRKVKNP